MRGAMGRYMVNFNNLIDQKVVGSALYDCFQTAFLAGATLNSMDNVRVAMFAEAPEFSLGNHIVNAAIIFSFVEQAKIITAMEFKSQTEIDVVIDRMSVVIDDIKLNKCDFFIVSDYRNVVALSALLIQHLAATRRVLPRVVRYQFPFNYPALALSNRIYAVASRGEELVAENDTVHPAFMQRNVTALSV
jgi:prophage DNA circulation protein